MSLRNDYKDQICMALIICMLSTVVDVRMNNSFAEGFRNLCQVQMEQLIGALQLAKF